MVMLAEHYDFVIGGDPDRDTIDLAILETGTGRVRGQSADRTDGPAYARLLHSRSRMRAASISPADAEAPTALIAYAAAPRSWAATCATAAACLAARAANLARSGNPRAAAFAAEAARRASPMRTSPRTHARPTSMASRGRVSRGCSSSKRCRTCSAQRVPTPLAADDARRSAFRRDAR